MEAEASCSTSSEAEHLCDYLVYDHENVVFGSELNYAFRSSGKLIKVSSIVLSEIQSADADIEEYLSDINDI